VSINFGFFVIALLLILYDIEFLLLIPVFFNLQAVNILAVAVYWVFLLFVAASFAVDWETASLK
jgi:NADH:ubiquinone oxidoreductase subunit 3 (subunit A)